MAEEQSSLWGFDAQWGQTVCGLDEAGRGPLAGPVYAACVCLKPGAEALLPHLNDSKKMTEKRREAAFAVLTAGEAAWFGIGSASPEEIDRENILRATFLAMDRAYAAMIEQMGETPPPSLALVDGNRDPGLPLPVRLVVKGDGRSASIAAASVLAKVSRDRVMGELDGQYPQYQFAKHKGYPTALHYEMLGKYGPSPVHRKSFLRTLSTHLAQLDGAAKPGKDAEGPSKEGSGAPSGHNVGVFGERYTEAYLIRQGYELLARNWRCPGGEVDLILRRGRVLAFVEVKTRDEGSLGAPEEAVDAAKQERLIRCARAFLAGLDPREREELQPRFDVAALTVRQTGGLTAVTRLDHLEGAFVLRDGEGEECYV